jgi:nucleotide-binding universal stress UspA family protein
MTIAFRKLLVPVSFEEVSFEAVGAIFLLHVVRSSEIPFPQWPYHLQDSPGEQDLGVEVVAKQRLRSIADARLGDGARVHVLTRIGDAAERIIEEGREIGIDLVVMPTHGRHGMARLFLGSVAEAVVRGATCPVLTVRGDRSTASATGR